MILDGVCARYGGCLLSRSLGRGGLLHHDPTLPLPPPFLAPQFMAVLPVREAGKTEKRHYEEGSHESKGSTKR